jgi:glycine C-acetyltransferase/8-amino-7-oxononanoate synthase
VAAALAALELVETRPRLVEKLRVNSEAMRHALEHEGFDMRGARTQILPLVVGDAGLAMRICENALERGVFAQAIRPPTVALGTARLRLAVMGTHHEQELRDAARTLAQVARTVGFEPRSRATRPAEEPPELYEDEDVRHVGEDFPEPVRRGVFDYEHPEARAA